MSDTSNSTESKPRRRGFRLALLLGVPFLAAVAGGAIYLEGGRYITTDNAYVSAQKVLITPEVSGKIASIAVSEGQHLKAGDVLFSLDQKPYELALEEAQAQMARTADEFSALKDKFAGMDEQISLSRETLALRQSEVDRKTALRDSRVVSNADVETERINLQDAKQSLSTLEVDQRDIRNQLGGSIDVQLEDYAPYRAAKATVERAQWNLEQTTLRAPVDGIATQVPNIQLGRYLSAGTTVFAVVKDTDVWVDANPKETDITYLEPGQDVSVSIDAFPGEPLKGRVSSISPATGSVFSLIPAQNASGNWVKVVQRVPVKVEFLPGQHMSRLRAGMSVNVEIDTHRSRSLATLFGTEAVAQTAQQ